MCAAILLTQFTACMTWRPVPGTLEQQVGAEHIPRARLDLRTAASSPSATSLSAPIASSATSRTPASVALSVTDVTTIERRSLSAGRTAATVVGTVAVTYIVLLGLAMIQLSNDIHAVPAPSVR